MLWMPREHGAWAWLVIPLAAGVLVAGPSVYQLPLSVSAFGGYFFFNAASWWAKMPPARRKSTFLPMIVYGTVTASATLAVILFTGPGVLGWYAIQGLGLCLAWVYTRRGDGRSLASGLATALSASILVMIAAEPNIASVPHPATLWTASFTFGYLGGTVFTVKSVVRQRGSVGWLAASVGWHVGWTAVSVVVVLLGGSVAWVVLWVTLSIRSAVVAWRARSRPLKPSLVGALEVIAASAFLAVVAFSA